MVLHCLCCTERTDLRYLPGRGGIRLDGLDQVDLLAVWVPYQETGSLDPVWDFSGNHSGFGG